MIKPGVGIVYDLGSEQEVKEVSIGLRHAGDHTTLTLYATDALSPKDLKDTVDPKKKIAGVSTKDNSVKLTVQKPVKTRYVLLWITEMPYAGYDNYSGAGYKQGITDVKFKG